MLFHRMEIDKKSLDSYSNRYTDNQADWETE